VGQGHPHSQHQALGSGFNQPSKSAHLALAPEDSHLRLAIDCSNEFSIFLDSVCPFLPTRLDGRKPKPVKEWLLDLS
jgi:hypothetical protein